MRLLYKVTPCHCTIDAEKVKKVSKDCLKILLDRNISPLEMTRIVGGAGDILERVPPNKGANLEDLKVVLAEVCIG